MKKEKKSSGFFHSEEIVTAYETYSYELSGIGKSIWKGECVSKADSRSEESGILIFKKTVGGDYKNFIHSKAGAEDGIPIELNIEANLRFDDKEIPKMKGYVKRGNIKLEIERTMNTKRNNLFPMYVGYYIYDNKKLVAVVQNMVKGAVYISSSIKPDLLPLVINASGIILTYYDLEQEVLADEE